MLTIKTKEMEQELSDELKNVFTEYCAEYYMDLLIYSEEHIISIDLTHDEPPTMYSLEDLKEHIANVYSTWIEQADVVDCKYWIDVRRGFIKVLNGTSPYDMKYAVWHETTECWYRVDGEFECDLLDKLFMDGYTLYEFEVNSEGVIMDNNYRSVLNGADYNTWSSNIHVIEFK